MFESTVFTIESLCMLGALCFLFYMLYVMIFTEQFNSNVGKPSLLFVLLSCISLLTTNLLFVNPVSYQFTSDDGWVFEMIFSFLKTHHDLGLVAYEFACYSLTTIGSTSMFWTCFRTAAVLRKRQSTQNLKYPYICLGIPSYGLPFVIFILISMEANKIDYEVYYLKYRVILIGTAGCLCVLSVAYVGMHLFTGLIMIHRSEPKREIILVFMRALIYICMTGAMLGFMVYFITCFDYGQQFVYTKAPYFSLFLGVFSSLTPILAFTFGRPIKQKNFNQIRVFQQIIKKKIHF